MSWLQHAFLLQSSTINPPHVAGSPGKFLRILVLSAFRFHWCTFSESLSAAIGSITIDSARLAEPHSTASVHYLSQWPKLECSVFILPDNCHTSLLGGASKSRVKMKVNLAMELGDVVEAANCPKLIQELKEWDVLNRSISKVVVWCILVWPYSLLFVCVLVGGRCGKLSVCMKKRMSAVQRASILILSFSGGSDTDISNYSPFMF